MFPWSSPVDKYMSRFGGLVVNDPITLTALSLGSMAVGGGMSAMSTIAGGNAAAQMGAARQAEANYQATQLKENAGSDLGAGQSQMLDKQLQTKLAISTGIADTAAGGVNAGVGSPVANAKALAGRGSYHSMMDLWQGQNQYTADLNKAAGATYSGDVALAGGQMTQSADMLKAMGTIAGTGGSMAAGYNKFMYPPVGGGSNYG